MAKDELYKVLNEIEAKYGGIDGIADASNNGTLDPNDWRVYDEAFDVIHDKTT